MIKIQNRSLEFTILYLPTRSLRLEGKATAEITQEELDSLEFKKREKEFRVTKQAPIIETPVEQEILDPPVVEPEIEVPKPKGKRKSKTAIETDTTILDIAKDSEPDDKI
jgi:hypothetical protein